MLADSIITIDGPASSGKSTVAQLLAAELGYLYFDTGVMYRAVTLAAIQAGIPIEDEERVSSCAEVINIEVSPPSIADGRQYDVLTDGMDVTWAIRSKEVDQAVSPVSTYRRVRTAMSQQQRRIGLQGSIVMVGRDIGTVVLPEAKFKFYLDASPEERAQRRFKELQERKSEITYPEVLEIVRKRDAIDSSRQIAPLIPAEDAVIINSDNLTISEVVNKMKDVICGIHID